MNSGAVEQDGSDSAHRHGVAPHGPASKNSALYIAVFLTSTLAIVQLGGGIYLNSLALTADSAHMFGDVVALLIALVARHVALRPASLRHSFGWRRAEVVGAQINGLLLLAVSGWIVLEALTRLGTASSVRGKWLIVFAVIGLTANLVSTGLLVRSGRDDVNMRAAALHTISDAAGSLGALCAGVAITVWNVQWADPVASIAIAILVVGAALRLLSETTHVLLEGAPRNVDVDGLKAALQVDPAVETVHHLHVWSLTSSDIALSAHVELAQATTLHEAQAEGARLKAMLAERFGVEHSTLELECHRCEVSEHTH